MDAAEHTSDRRQPRATTTRPPEPIFLSAGHVAARRQPEKRLMVAILESAINDLQHYATTPHGRGRRFFIEAKAWFASSATNGPGDFEFICQALEFDPSAIRTRLGRWCTARRGSGAPEDGRGASDWWLRGFACMTSADAPPSVGGADIRNDEVGPCETLPGKGLVS